MKRRGRSSRHHRIMDHRLYRRAFAASTVGCDCNPGYGFFSFEANSTPRADEVKP
jgi:hypothetical protein